MTETVDPLVFTRTFGITGTHAVTVAVWNCAMSTPVTDVVTLTVYAQDVCVDLTSVTIDGATSGYPGTYTFTTDYEPSGASTPISYTWQDGSIGNTLVDDLDVGTHTLVVTATNCASALVTDDHEIVITAAPVCTAVTDVELAYTNTGTIYTDTVVHFQADVTPDNAARPYSYTVTTDGAVGSVMTETADPLVFTRTFGLTGTHAVTVAVWNCAMSTPVTDVVTFTVYAQDVCVPVTGVELALSTEGSLFIEDVLSFEADIAPPGATRPYTYQLTFDGTPGTAMTDTVNPLVFTRTFTASGPHTVDIGVWNCAMSASEAFTDTVSFTTYSYTIYLPLVMRNS
jgi:uncharacterized cupin superfamily protein